MFQMQIFTNSFISSVLVNLEEHLHMVLIFEACLHLINIWFRVTISQRKVFLSSNQFSSVQLLSSAWLCDLMSTSGLPVQCQLPESTQTHVHWVGDAIQSSHPLSSPSLPALNPSQHQGLFKWVSSSQQVAKVLKFQLQHQTFQWTPRTDLL